MTTSTTWPNSVEAEALSVATLAGERPSRNAASPESRTWTLGDLIVRDASALPHAGSRRTRNKSSSNRMSFSWVLRSPGSSDMALLMSRIEAVRAASRFRTSRRVVDRGFSSVRVRPAPQIARCSRRTIGRDRWRCVARRGGSRQHRCAWRSPAGWCSNSTEPPRPHRGRRVATGASSR